MRPGDSVGGCVRPGDSMGGWVHPGGCVSAPRSVDGCALVIWWVGAPKGLGAPRWVGCAQMGEWVLSPRLVVGWVHPGGSVSSSRWVGGWLPQLMCFLNDSVVNIPHPIHIQGLFTCSIFDR